MPFLDLVTGVRLHYRDCGAGEPLLFLGGFAATVDTWNYAVLDLQDSYRCVSVDLRGHGKSDKPASAYTYDEMCGDLQALLAGLGLRRVTLVGWSMGAAVALKYVTACDERIARLVMVAPATPRFTRTPTEPYGLDDAGAAATLEGIRRRFPETMADFADANFHRTDLEATKAWMLSQWLELPAYAAYAYTRTLIAEDLREHVARVAIPTAMFHGRHDTICDPGWVEYMAARIPGARTVWFENSSHALMLEEPDRFSEELRAFLNSAGAERPLDVGELAP
jgi:pimeloyl-ACP methyl ester carboxylesterase